MRSILVTAAMLGLVVCGSANGAPLTYSFTGTITGAGANSGLHSGDTFTGLLGYDPATPEGHSSGLSYLKNYEGSAANWLQVTANGNTILRSSEFVQISDGQPGGFGDYFYTLAQPLGFKLISSSGLTFTSPTLPASLNLSDFDLTDFFRVQSSPNAADDFRGVVTSLNLVVPEPSALLLAAFGTVSLVYVRRFMCSLLTVLLIATQAILSANGATLTAKLVATPIDAVGNPGLYNIEIQVESIETTSGSADGGVAGMRFDILSDGHGLSAAVPVGAGQFAPVKTTWSITNNDFFLLVPRARDALPADNPANPIYDADGDRDAMAGRFVDMDFMNLTLGRGGLQTVATIQWQLSSAGMSTGDHLSLVVIDPTYYDLSSAIFANQPPYATVNATGTYLSPVPEPSCFVLIAFAIAELFYVRRRTNRRDDAISKDCQQTMVAVLEMKRVSAPSAKRGRLRDRLHCLRV